MKQDHEDFQGHLDHQVLLVVKEFLEKLEILDRWGSQVIEALMDHQENLDLMDYLDLQVQPENQAIQDQRVQEDFQGFQVLLD